MSIRNGLLALLEHGPRYGYQLRTEFEATTGGTWPLNIGQVYTTLGRLERDGLVVGAGADEQGRSVYEITSAGRVALADWFATPIARAERGRDELAIKLAVAVTLPEVDLRDIIQRQRTATLRSLQEFTRLKRAADPDADLAWLLVLDSMIFGAEAEARWLDHCETQLVRRRRGPAAAAADAASEAGRTERGGAEPTRTEINRTQPKRTEGRPDPATPARQESQR